MNTLKMLPDTLFNLTSTIVDAIEKNLLSTMHFSNQQIYLQLEETLAYSFTHMRDTFKLATNISLVKYITRRKYTTILQQMSSADFDKLTVHTKINGISKFKGKCLHEFPLIRDNFCLENMQQPIDKSILKTMIDNQLALKSIESVMKTLYKDIIDGRNQFEIIPNNKDIIVQTSKDTIIDLEKTYFTFEDKIFKITAELNIPQHDIEDPLLSILFAKPTYQCYNLKANANCVIHILHEFLMGNIIPSNGFSINIEWSCKNGWGTRNLISSISFDETKLKSVELNDIPFLHFNNDNVILNLSFFENL